MNRRDLDQQSAYRALVPVNHKALKGGGSEDKAFERPHVDAVQPSQNGRISARTRPAQLTGRQVSPVKSGIGMMFGVIAVIEEEEIIDPSIIANCPAGMLEVALKAA